MNKRTFLALVVLSMATFAFAQNGVRIVKSLNFGWRFHAGNVSGAEKNNYNDTQWRMVNVPHDFLTVTYLPEKGTFKWSVGKQFKDTLQYFKINGENPNKHVIRNDASQVVEMNLSVNDGYKFCFILAFGFFFQKLCFLFRIKTVFIGI